MKLLWWLNRKRFAFRLMPVMVVTGIALSTGALLVTVGVARGFEKEFKKALLQFYPHVTIQPEPGLALPEEEVRRALGQREYTLNPFLYREALGIHQGKIHGVVFKGIPGLGEVRLGEVLAEKLGKGPVKIMLPSQKTIRLEVGRPFRTGLYELDEQFALIDLDRLRKLFDLPPALQGYEIRLPDPDQAPSAARDLAAELPPFLIQNWADDHRPLLEAFQLEKWFFRLLIGFMLLVSLLNLVAAISLSIFHRTRWIAILRALGFSCRKTVGLFALEGIVLGAAGIFFGLALGGTLLFSLQYFQWIALDPQVYFLTKLPIDLSVWDGLITFLFGFFVTVIVSGWAAQGSAAVSIREGLHGPG